MSNILSPTEPVRRTRTSGIDRALQIFDYLQQLEQSATAYEIARAVGKKMAGLGSRHQVVAITHFPQVAALAARHYVVEKEVAGGRTRSKMYPVNGDGRISELVRMLGGGGDSARAMAASLLNGA